jgi:hypothetical protein
MPKTVYSYKASVADCGFCSNNFTERNAIIVRSADRHAHKTCLGKKTYEGFVMDRNDPETTMILRDPDITVQCADCYADVPVESTKEEE